MGRANGPEVKNWDEVFKEEHSYLTSKASEERKSEQIMGIALSGGGVRAASFSLGVFQAFIAFNVASKFQYLSSVSGGGYLGAAVAWLRKKYGDEWSKQFISRVGVRQKAETLAPHASVADKQGVYPRQEFDGNKGAGWVWLDYIRQHSNYLQPPKLELPSLAAVAIRNTALSIGVYLALLSIIFTLLMKWSVLGAESSLQCWELSEWHLALRGSLCFDATSLAYAVLTFLIATFVAYSLGSFVVSWAGTHEIHLAVVVLGVAIGSILLGLRFQFSGDWLQIPYDMVPRRLSSAALLTGILMLLAYLVVLRAWLKIRNKSLVIENKALDSDRGIYWLRVALQRWGGFGVIALVALTAIAQLDNFYDKYDIVRSAYLAAAILLAMLVLRAIIHRFRPTAENLANAGWFSAFFAFVVSTGAVSAYVLARRLEDLGWAQLGVLALTVVIIGFCTDLNQFGIGRMYRDRLMEAFMPDIESIETAQWKEALQANESDAELAKIWEPTAEACLYPIFNTNVVLIDSKVDRYRNRGGDSFMLTPKFSGSNATGWVSTAEFADKELKAGTAMAISGAAANPNAAIGGHGFTRNRLVAFLMFLAQARLGAWVGNPNWSSRGFVAALVRRLLKHRPNFIFPGISSGLLGLGQHEKSYFLELTDGGHFDNTGAYELIRRRAKLIVLVQASQDHDFSFKDLANLAQKVRVDFGARLFFRDGLALEGVVPVGRRGKRTRFADRGHAIAKIKYAHDSSEGWLVYLQATPLSGLPVDVHSYQQENAEFPNEPTANQFFREGQLEAYRELGYAVAKRFLMDVLCKHERDCNCGLDNGAELHPQVDTCLAEINEWLKPVREPYVSLRGRTERIRRSSGSLSP